ncbi:MAG: NAD-dependent epimerase/dehydratase family protein [bacterium]|nr:NAD-dependent epimerase/dehydratase family protein [bacterium]
MKILVCGGAGFIGSHIVEHFHNDADVIVYDSLRTGFVENITNFNVDFIEDDIRNRDAVRKAMQGVDYVFLLSALVSVPESMKNSSECVDINAKGTLIVLEEAAKAGVKKLCLSSTSAIYGDNPVFPKIETMMPEPKSPYAVTKLDGEFYCNIFTQEKKLKTACMRYFNVFGPRQDPKSAYAAAIPIFTANAVKNMPISVYGDGEQTRDFVYVKDVVAANVFLSQNDSSGVFNVGYGRQTTVNSLIKEILKLTSSASKIEYLPERSGDVKHSVASIEKLLSNNFVLNDRFDEGLKVTVDYFKNK